ncbi:hypothetical protein HHK36_029814 [Tetracentron sinense]|uniref:Cytochrome P450 n=1 Tax=Tetracentron sinense TaxID=13715 RepID=A0A834YA77_TETSI|nr:hypothetical protein HHK36_029814 [Tetracentron sinense]
MSSWIIIALLVAVIGGFTYLQRSAKHRNNDRRLPPGPRGLPVIGHLHMLGNLPHRNLYRLAKKYGPIMYLRLGVVPVVVVSSPKAAELFLKTHDTIFASRPDIEATKYLSHGRKGLAFAEYGSYWRNLRKMCTLELLTNFKIDSFKGMRREEVALLIRSLKDVAKDGAVVDLSAKVGSLVEDMTHRMLFGYSRDEGFDIKPVLHEVLNLVGAFNLADYIPYVGALDLQGLTRGMKSVSKAVDEFLEKMIDAHVRDARYQQGQHKDFMDVMLSFMMMESKDTQDDQPNYMMDRANIKPLDKLKQLSKMMAGNFNAIVSLEEKIGGREVKVRSMEDFNSFTNDLGLIDAGEMQMIKRGSTSVADFILKIKSITDDDFISHTLNGLFNDYESFITTISNHVELISFVEPQSCLLHHEQRLALMHPPVAISDAQSTALFTGRQPNRGSCPRGHGLATAIALMKVGIRALVLERSHELRATGGALNLFPNAWVALEALGVAHKLTRISEIKIEIEKPK